MNFNKCSRCGGFFVSDGNTCPNCLQKDEMEMYRLESFIEENSDANLNLESIAFGAGISEKNLNRFLNNDQFNDFLQKNML